MVNSPSETGKVSGKTMFTQTCDRLREYMKENGPLGINIPISSPKTMNLFPVEMRNCDLNPVSNVNIIVEEDIYDSKKMTIFYNGRVIVVDDVSSEKANEIMSVATSLSLSAAPLPHVIARDLSQTRSRSLTRFFEKRKERIDARGPYILRDKSWLGLSAASPEN